MGIAIAMQSGKTQVEVSKVGLHGVAVVIGAKGKWGHNPRISLGDIVAGVGCSARGGDNGFDVLDWPGMSQQSVANHLLGSAHAVLI